MNDDIILRTYARLKALLPNIPKNTRISERYANEYNEIVSGFEDATKNSLLEFKLPETDLKNDLSLAIPNYETGRSKKYYTIDKRCDRALLLAKLEACINYLELLMRPAEPRKIGIRTDD